MTIADVKTKVKEILSNSDQSQKLRLRFKLFSDVLIAIASGNHNDIAAELAKEAIVTKE